MVKLFYSSDMTTRCPMSADVGQAMSYPSQANHFNHMILRHRCIAYGTLSYREQQLGDLC